MKYNLPYLFYIYLPKLLSIIFIFITKKNTESEIHSVSTNVTRKNYHLIKIKQYGKKMILLLCVVSLLEVLYDNIDSILYYYQMNGIIKWLVEKKRPIFFS